MTYTDKDIQDLYEDLKTVGAAETPAEREARHLQEAAAAGALLAKGMTMGQASDVLTTKGIPHTFYTMLWKSQIGENLITNFIMVKGLTAFCERKSSGPSIDNLSPKGVKEFIEEFDCNFISDAHYTDHRLLPNTRPNQDQTTGPAGAEINSTTRHPNTTPTTST